MKFFDQNYESFLHIFFYMGLSFNHIVILECLFFFEPSIWRNPTVEVPESLHGEILGSTNLVWPTTSFNQYFFIQKWHMSHFPWFIWLATSLLNPPAPRISSSKDIVKAQVESLHQQCFEAQLSVPVIHVFVPYTYPCNFQELYCPHCSL
jgi:hypothetical protein